MKTRSLGNKTNNSSPQQNQTMVYVSFFRKTKRRNLRVFLRCMNYHHDKQQACGLVKCAKCCLKDAVNSVTWTVNQKMDVQLY